MNLEDSLLHKVTQSKQDKYYMIPLYEVARVIRSIRTTTTKNRMVVAKD
jgi:hypothetical protein